MRERKKDRIFRIIRSIAWMVFIFAMFAFFSGPSEEFQDPALGTDYAAVVDLDGTILAGNESASFQSLHTALERAFSGSSKGVVLRVNSPGGSPVQADLIRRELLRLKKKYGKRLIVVGEEMLTSGAYMVSMAADEIYTNPATIVGSVGVRMDSFGATGLMEKLGVERRVYSSGEHKVALDPFLPEKSFDVKHVNKVLDEIHGQFIDMVKQGRGDRLVESPELYSGLYWTGEKAQQLGLIDGTATLHEAIQREFGVDQYRVFEPRLDVWKKLNMFVGSVSKLSSILAEGQAGVKAEFSQ